MVVRSYRYDAQPTSLIYLSRSVRSFAAISDRWETYLMDVC